MNCTLEGYGCACVPFLIDTPERKQLLGISKNTKQNINWIFLLTWKILDVGVSYLISKLPGNFAFCYFPVLLPSPGRELKKFRNQSLRFNILFQHSSIVQHCYTPIHICIFPGTESLPSSISFPPIHFLPLTGFILGTGGGKGKS